jgi:hypothetical protein
MIWISQTATAITKIVNAAPLLSVVVVAPVIGSPLVVLPQTLRFEPANFCDAADNSIPEVGEVLLLG